GGGGVGGGGVGQGARGGGGEPSRQPPVQRQAEAAPLPGEVLAKFPRGGVQAGRSVEDAGADPVGQRLQDGVVILAGVSNPDQPSLGRGQQQRADRAVDGPVGDVKDPIPLRRRGQPGAQPAQVAGGAGEGPRQLAGELIPVHRPSPFVLVPVAPWWLRLSVAMPSAAARRAASALPPTMAATSV